MRSRQYSKKFPDRATVRRVRDKLSDPAYEGGNWVLPENATETERVKYELCQIIARYRREHELLQKDLARTIGVDESRISDILRGKIGSFTLDRLIGYAAKLHPRLRVRVVAA